MIHDPEKIDLYEKIHKLEKELSNLQKKQTLLETENYDLIDALYEIKGYLRDNSDLSLAVINEVFNKWEGFYKNQEEAKGTYNCPICGKDFPHKHSQSEYKIYQIGSTANKESEL